MRSLNALNPPLPTPDAIVLARVLRLSPRQATLSILVIAGIPLHEGDGEYQGLVRVQDVRSTEKDKIKIGECFGVGDIVKAVVISLGDSRSYYLSTARNDLGVIFATSQSG